MVSKLDLQTSDFEDGPVREAFLRIAEYIEERDTDTLASHGIKSKVFEATAGPSGSSTEYITHDLPGEVSGAIGAFEYPPLGGVSFKRWAPFGSNLGVNFFPADKKTQVVVRNTYTIPLFYRLTVFYKGTL